ncbi:MAG: ester cyclase, partial [Pseudonocardiaceae bacterium]
NKAVSRQWHEAWGTSGITAAYAECLAPEFTAEFFGQGTVDRATYIARDQEFAAGFSDIRMTVEELAAEGDRVMVRMTWRGRHTGDALGFPATGRRFEVAGFAVDRFRSGKVIAHVPLFDQLGLLRQLGVAAVPEGYPG